MRNILRTILKMRKITLFLAVIVSLLGLLNYHLAPKHQSPKITLSTVMITTLYPGAAANDVEKLVSSKIEDALNEFKECKEIRSYSRNSISIVVFSVNYSKDYTDDWDQLRRVMADLHNQLPQGVQPSCINTEFAKTAGVIYAISGNDYSYNDLNDYANLLVKELEALPGVANFRIEGMVEDEILIELDNDKMSYLDISYDELVRLIKSANLEIPSGEVENKTGKIHVRTKGFLTSINDIENIVVAVSSKTGTVTTLKDIGEINIVLEKDRIRTKINLDKALFLVGYFEEGKNIIPIGESIEHSISLAKQSIPPTINIDRILFEPQAVKDNLTGFINSLLQGIIFVIIVVFIGMGIRNAMIVSVAIPLSIFSTFSLITLFNVEIHQISIVALLIALGMLVDNAIVVADAIQNRMDQGQMKMDACIEGVLEVATPILTSTLTTVCTFMPILFIDSEIGDYLKSMPIVVISALFSSYIVALTVTPAMAYIFFTKRKISKKTFRFTQGLHNLLTFIMAKRYLVFLTLSIVILITFNLGKNIGLKFFPFAQTNMMYIDVHSEISSDIEQTEKIVNQVIGILNTYNEIDTTIVEIGDGLPRFFDTMFPAFPSKDYAQILIKFDTRQIGKDYRFTTTTTFRDHLQKKLDTTLYNGVATVNQLEQGEPVGAPVSIEVLGEDINTISKVAKDIENILKKIDGTVNVNTDFVHKEYEYLIDIDKTSASMRGLDNYTMQNEVNISLQGRDLGIIRMNNHEYILRLKSNIDSINQLRNLRVKSQITSKKIVLNDVSTIKLASVYPVIKKMNRAFAITVSSDVLQNFSAVGITDALSEQLMPMNDKHLKIMFTGEKDAIHNNFGQLGITALMFLLLIYAILLFQFKSFIEPFIILLTIPLSAIGSILGLYITKTSLSFTALLGIVSLAGIVVNNAIVLIDYINHDIGNGVPRKQACIDAAIQRFRPIMLSTITTVIGLIPLIMLKSDLFTPMAISLMSGLLISTLLTIVVIPVVTSTLKISG